MKKQYFFFFLLLANLLHLDVAAQSKKVKAVSRAVESLRAAMIEADSASLDALTKQELSYGHSSGRVENKASFISSLTSGASDFVTINLTEQMVHVEDKTAIVRHVLTAQTNDNGKPGTVKLAVLTVWEKDWNKWKLLARQAVRL
jgi:ketosteroid isomerase-like protein